MAISHFLTMAVWFFLLSFLEIYVHDGAAAPNRNSIGTWVRWARGPLLSLGQ